MDLKMGLDYSRASKTLFLTQITQILIKWTSKPFYCYSARRDLSIDAWFDFIGKKKIFDFFWPKGGPLPRKMTKIFFLQIWSNHAPFERSHRADREYVVFEVRLINIWMMYVKNSYFRAPLKLNPIFKAIFPSILGLFNFLNIPIYSKFNAELKSFFQIEFPLFFYGIFKF